MWPLIATPTIIYASKLVYDGPALLLGVIVNSTTPTAVWKIYDKTQTDGNKPIIHIITSTNGNEHFMPAFPILCDNGLYVEIDGDVTDLTVLWCPYTPALADLLTPS